MLTKRCKCGLVLCLGFFPLESWVVWSQKLMVERAQKRSHKVRCQILERRAKMIKL